MPTPSELTPYERGALAEIDAFKNPHPTVLSRIGDIVAEPLQKGVDLALSTGVGAAISKAVSGVVTLVNDGASWTVRSDAIFQEFRKAGHVAVRRPGDVQALSLEDVDKVVGYLGAKYRTIAALEGGAAGALGAIGLAFDVPALVGIALRAINEHAVYYGLDQSLEGERKFALSLLGAASSPTLIAKHQALAQLTRLSAMLAEKATWSEIEKLGFAEIIKGVAESVGARLSKQKLGEIVPIVGAAVGAGVNIWYVANVTEAAYMLYRERFLIAKYGPEIGVPVR